MVKTMRQLRDDMRDGNEELASISPFYCPISFSLIPFPLFPFLPFPFLPFPFLAFLFLLFPFLVFPFPISCSVYLLFPYITSSFLLCSRHITTEKNVERTAELDALNQALNSKKEALQQLQAAVRAQQERQVQVQERLSPAVLLDRLVEAAQVAEAESDEIALNYLDSMFSVSIILYNSMLYYYLHSSLIPFYPVSIVSSLRIYHQVPHPMTTRNLSRNSQKRENYTTSVLPRRKAL